MTSKKIFTIILLLFVVGSVVYLIQNEISSANRAATAKIPEPSTTTDSPSQASPGPNDPTAEPRFVAYYFHGNVRCPTCRSIEAYSQEGIEAAFPELVEMGELKWQAVNTDEVWNAHYVTDFNLQFSSLVLAEIANGETLRWENLEKVWELVHDKESFLDYVRSKAKTFMTEGAI